MRCYELNIMFFKRIKMMKNLQKSAISLIVLGELLLQSAFAMEDNREEPGSIPIRQENVNAEESKEPPSSPLTIRENANLENPQDEEEEGHELSKLEEQGRSLVLKLANEEPELMQQARFISLKLINKEFVEEEKIQKIVELLDLTRRIFSVAFYSEYLKEIEKKFALPEEWNLIMTQLLMVYHFALKDSYQNSMQVQLYESPGPLEEDGLPPLEEERNPLFEEGYSSSEEK